MKNLTEEQKKNPISKIDFTELRKQKRLLLETINNDAVSPEHKEGLEGILHLIDNVQDYAVDELGWDEKIVFDFEVEEKREKTLIGYQVVGIEGTEAEGEINPHMEGSFCLYSLEQAREILNKDSKFGIWKLLPIYEGDIEKPTFMFDCDPNS